MQKFPSLPCAGSKNKSLLISLYTALYPSINQACDNIISDIVLKPEKYIQAIPCTHSGLYFPFPRLELSTQLLHPSILWDVGYAHLCQRDSHTLMLKGNPWISVCVGRFLSLPLLLIKVAQYTFRKAHK